MFAPTTNRLPIFGRYGISGYHKDKNPYLKPIYECVCVILTLVGLNNTSTQKTYRTAVNACVNGRCKSALNLENKSFDK